MLYILKPNEHFVFCVLKQKANIEYAKKADTQKFDNVIAEYKVIVLSFIDRLKFVAS